jgi:hypothetical protein
MFLYKNYADSFIGGVCFDNALLSGVEELSFGSFFRDAFKFVECLLLL